MHNHLQEPIISIAVPRYFSIAGAHSMTTVCLQTCTHPPLLDDTLCHMYTVTVQNSSAKFRAKICYTSLDAVAAQSRRELFLVPAHVFYPVARTGCPHFTARINVAILKLIRALCLKCSLLLMLTCLLAFGYFWSHTVQCFKRLPVKSVLTYHHCRCKMP